MCIMSILFILIYNLFSVTILSYTPHTPYPIFLSCIIHNSTGRVTLGGALSEDFNFF